MILVTGGAKGLGAAICKALAQQGHSVLVHYRNSQSGAEKIAEECGQNSQTIFGDFSTQETLQSFLESYQHRFSKTKGLINNVGNYFVAPATETSPQQWTDLFQTNLLAPIALTNALLPMLKKERGTIINIGSAGLLGSRANTYATAYMATKSGLWFWTRSLAKELASEGITVNMVSPGILENSIDLARGPIVTLKEAARVVCTFFEKENRAITGQNIEVAGGFAL